MEVEESRDIRLEAISLFTDFIENFGNGDPFKALEFLMDVYDQKIFVLYSIAFSNGKEAYLGIWFDEDKGKYFDISVLGDEYSVTTHPAFMIGFAKRFKLTPLTCIHDHPDFATAYRKVLSPADFYVFYTAMFPSAILLYPEDSALGVRLYDLREFIKLDRGYIEKVIGEFTNQIRKMSPKELLKYQEKVVLPALKINWAERVYK